MPTITKDRGCTVIVSAASETILLSRDLLDLDPTGDRDAAEPPRNLVVQVIPGAGWSGSLTPRQKMRAAAANWIRGPYLRWSDGAVRDKTTAIASADAEDQYVFDLAGGNDLQIAHACSAGGVTLVVQAGAY